MAATSADRSGPRAMRGLEGQERARHRRQLGHRAGDRRALRRVRRERRDQLPAQARTRPTRPRSRCRPACTKVRSEGVRDVLVQGDVSKEDDVVRMVGEAVEQLGGLDVLVNNAGIQISRPSDELSSADFDRVIAVNLRGVVPVRPRGDPALPRGGQARASIVNVSSVHQMIPKPDYLGYSASQGRDAEPHPDARARVRRSRASASTASARARRSRRSTAPGSTTRSSAGRSRSHIPMRRAGTADEMAGVARVPGQRRRRLHHRPDDLRRRRPDPVPELRDAVVLGVTRRAPLVAVAVRRGRQLGMLNHVDERKRREALASSARVGSTTSAACSTRRIPVVPGPLLPPDARDDAHHANGGGVGANEVNWITEQVVRDDAARHAPRRALPPADRRPRLQRLVGRRARRHAGRPAARRRDGPADRHPRLARRRRAASAPAT